MKNEKLINSFKFSVDQNIIICNVHNDAIDFNEEYLKECLEGPFSKKISTLSNGKCLPILINIRALSFKNSIKVFNFLSKNSKIKSIVLSEIFLVNSYLLKALLILQNFIGFTSIPDEIFKSCKAAIYYCYDNNKMFNAVS